MTEAVTAYILDKIPFEPDWPGLLRRLHIKEGSDSAAELCELLNQARPLARPRTLYLSAFIGERGEDWVEIEGQRLNSRVLRVNLELSYRVFPYLASCGPELQTWAEGVDDMLLRFWAETIKEEALHCARRALNEHLEAHFHPGKLASMNPGSLPDWPIQQQINLFELFAGRQRKIGVQLTPTMLMVPTKTVSGIFFPTEVTFESCQLCPREGCPGRRAPYDPDLYTQRYGLPAR